MNDVTLVLKSDWFALHAATGTVLRCTGPSQLAREGVALRGYCHTLQADEGTWSVVTRKLSALPLRIARWFARADGVPHKFLSKIVLPFQLRQAAEYASCYRVLRD